MGIDNHKIIIYTLDFHFKVKRGLEMIHHGMKPLFALDGGDSQVQYTYLKVTNPLLGQHVGIL
jgi:hypothetical protein